MAVIVGSCKLCLCDGVNLVDSHIVPRSFYEEYKGKPLIAFSELTARSSTIRKGIYGKFLCDECEKKFHKVDDEAFLRIKNGKDTLSLVKDVLKRELLVIEDAYSYKSILHKFALSVLWRAKNSDRPEYPLLALGSYEEKIRLAFHSNQFSQDLLDATGISLWKFRGSDLSEADATNYIYRSITKKTNPNFAKKFGDFRCHIFGYPYGEMLIRLGGERPKQGYFQTIEDVHKPSVLWSSNLCIKFPNLVVCKTPRVRDDGSLVGTKFQKEIFSIISKAEIRNDEKA